MDAGPFPSIRHAAHDLTKAPGFVLGPLSVDPSARRISNGERSEMLEPRVMRVLVALGGAHGKVLSRDDLIDFCWDGTIVGENAIKRVIFRLRHALDDLSGGAVSLETITKVGFRLVYEPVADETVPAPAPAPLLVARAPAEPPVWARKLTRRAAAGGVVVIGAGAAFAFARWNQPLPQTAGLSARALFERGMLMRRSASPGNAMAAISYFEQAVALDPNLADAWGALAISYCEPRRGIPTSTRLIASAAKRALALDPHQSEGQLALIRIEPEFGRWLDHEQRLRSIVQRHPDHPLSVGSLGMLLESVGRFEEAIAFYRHMLDVEPGLPFGWARLSVAQHYAGREYEADTSIEAGFKRFPAHMLLWISRFTILIGSKRYAEAATFARDSSNIPPMLPPQFQTFHVGVAEALVTKKGIDRTVSRLRGNIASDIQRVQGSVPMLVELGATSSVFDALEAYYLGGRYDGRRIHAPGLMERHPTWLLFAPGVLTLRGDPRHAALLKRTGLEDYWRKSGTKPDYRRG